jgi:uncharacterized SAM-binding protein YcdF (DUF218 family)
MMFLFKKMLANIFSPISLCLLLLLAGLVFLWFTRRQKTGKVLVSAGFVLLLALGYGWGFAPVLKSLEREYAPLTVVPADAGVKWVVVLGGGTSSDAGIPLTSRLSEASLGRLVEGIRLYKQIPGVKLLVSGGHVFNSGVDGESMQALAVSLGVNPADILVDKDSPDTETQALVVRQMVGDDTVILVTSASHLPRSVGLFKKAGVRVLPAPAHYLVQTDAKASPTDVFPGSGNVLQAERVVYEYLGIVWAKLRGRME